MDGQLMGFGLETSGFTAEKRTHFLTRQAVHGQSTMQAVPTFFVGAEGLTRKSYPAKALDQPPACPHYPSRMAQSRRNGESHTDGHSHLKRRGFRTVMGGPRRSWLVQRFYRRTYLVAGPLPKIAIDHAQSPLARMPGLTAYR